MNNIRLVIITAIMALALGGAVAASWETSQLESKQSSADEMLYFVSGKTLKRFSLGYSSLLANIYWTRAVQYFGAKHLTHARRYDLLYPLLNITTDLDPHLMVAYQNGAIFLSAAPPGGAGQPDKAVALIEKGIRNNPEFWRLYFTLGFIHYMDRKDYKSAQQAFERGSEVPGALPWMKVMAATMAQHAGERSTALAIWSRLYESTQDPGIRQNAVQHLRALGAEMQMDQLEERIRLFREKTGRLPASWVDLMHAKLLSGVPLDPTGKPYKLMPDGRVEVQDPGAFPYLNRDRSSGR